MMREGARRQAGGEKGIKRQCIFAKEHEDSATSHVCCSWHQIWLMKYHKVQIHSQMGERGRALVAKGKIIIVHQRDLVWAPR